MGPLGGNMAELFQRDAELAESGRSLALLTDVLELHRKNGSLSDLYFLPSLCFDLPETADGQGVRFVLWQPIAEFLRFGFDIEMQELLCHGHLGIVFLDHDAARFASRLGAEVEAVRRVAPKSMITSGPEILLQLIDGLVTNPEIDPKVGEKLVRMARAFRAAIRRGDHSDLPSFRAQLSELAGSAGEEDIRRCIDLLRRAESERSWPANSSALLSEHSLARDWLDAEEDAAWSHL